MPAEGASVDGMEVVGSPTEKCGLSVSSTVAMTASLEDTPGWEALHVALPRSYWWKHLSTCAQVAVAEQKCHGWA